ncbi:MAG: hypothetical protein J3R72DRAFT_492789 [Linnemannia gamsii]|nr:MAG: hypothetical protein J3R72DRAFT_492789 [Linnemannia gamsii]
MKSFIPLILDLTMSLFTQATPASAPNTPEKQADAYWGIVAKPEDKDTRAMGSISTDPGTSQSLFALQDNPTQYDSGPEGLFVFD